MTRAQHADPKHRPANTTMSNSHDSEEAVQLQSASIQGHVDPQYTAVAEAFEENFAVRGDSGAACTVIVGGRTVVDLWGGSAGGVSWTRDTRSVVFSVSKGITTICLLMAVEADHLKLDAPVAHYWPEFAQAGKDAMTVRQLLAHQAGLVAPERPMTMEDLRAWEPVTDALAAQTPMWRPGSGYAYHALTVGWLAGEVLRRATGLRPAQWLRERIAEPLGLRLQFGADPTDPSFALQGEPLPGGPAPDTDPVDQDLTNRVMGMNGAFDGLNLFKTVNSADFLSFEMPAANLVSSARDLARLYAATIGEVDGVRLLHPGTIRDARLPQSFGGPLLGPHDGNRWATGFLIDSSHRGMAGPGSFGHDGAGGQLAFANPEREVAFAYTTIRPGDATDRRGEELCSALRSTL